MKISKDLKKLMSENKFELIRQGKHMVWGDAYGRRVSVSCTASDHRAILSVARDIRRAIREMPVAA